jgi:hypothetical protein
MSAPTLLPAPRITGAIEPALAELAEQKLLSPAREAGYDLRLVGATVLPQRQVIARTQWGKWLFVSHVHDPTAQQYGGKIPLPAAEHERLTELHLAGVRPDLVWLGHQLPDTWEAGQPVPVPSPAHLREKDERLTLRLAEATRLYIRGAGMLLTAATAAPLAALAALGAGLDPIVLGGVRHPQFPLVEWALLAQWEWE